MVTFLTAVELRDQLDAIIALNPAAKIMADIDSMDYAVLDGFKAVLDDDGDARFSFRSYNTAEQLRMTSTKVVPESIKNLSAEEKVFNVLKTARLVIFTENETPFGSESNNVMMPLNAEPLTANEIKEFVRSTVKGKAIEKLNVLDTKTAADYTKEQQDEIHYRFNKNGKLYKVQYLVRRQGVQLGIRLIASK